MRCSRCDLPISPTRTTCPRCGANTNKSATNSPLFLASDAPKAFQAPTSVEEPRLFSSPPQKHKQGYRSTTIGFGLAGLCLMMASLLLVFVYFMAQNLPLPSNGLSSRLTGGQSNLPTTSAKNTSVAQSGSTPPPPATSPAVTYLGRQYIDNAQMATAISAEALPVQPETTFRTNQTMYITFKVHPDGRIGAVCLLWYLNTRQFTNYSFAINTTVSSPAYSYATTGSSGSGYVEIYWETAPSCTDPNKILADRVAFAVTA